MVNNLCIFIGRLTADPELKYTESGIAHVRFSIAVDGYPGQNGEKHTNFIKVHVWRKLAENVAQYMRKGRQIAVQGELQIRSYDDQNGVRREGHEIVANDVRFLDRAKDTAGQTDPDDDGASEPVPTGAKSTADEPVPF